MVEKSLKDDLGNDQITPSKIFSLIASMNDFKKMSLCLVVRPCVSRFTYKILSCELMNDDSFRVSGGYLSDSTGPIS